MSLFAQDSQEKNLLFSKTFRRITLKKKLLLLDKDKKNDKTT